MTDAATVVATAEGVVLLYYRYDVKALRTSMTSDQNGSVICKVQARGGNIEGNSNLLPSSITCETQPAGLGARFADLPNTAQLLLLQQNTRELSVMVLTRGSNMYLWRESAPMFRYLIPIYRRRRLGVIDFVFTMSNFLVVSDIGEVQVMELYAHKRFHENIYYRSAVVPFVRKAMKIYSDPLGDNFAFLTNDVFQCSEMRTLRVEGHLHQDLSKLLSGATLEDDLHDAVIECAESKFPVHKVVLAARSRFFREKFYPDETILDKSKTSDEPQLITLKNCNKETLKELLHYAYGGVCPTLGHPSTWGYFLKSCKYNSCTSHPCHNSLPLPATCDTKLLSSFIKATEQFGLPVDFNRCDRPFVSL